MAAHTVAETKMAISPLLHHAYLPRLPSTRAIPVTNYTGQPLYQNELVVLHPELLTSLTCRTCR